VTTLCGADGCRNGWIAVLEKLGTGTITWQVHPTLNALASTTEAALIALDVPIGLPDCGARACAVAARRLLGPGRGSSVFPAPIRPLLDATSHGQACDIRETLESKRLSIQAWAIVPKIREVDEALRVSEGLRSRVREVHPEVCFYHLASGRPMVHAKKRRDGREERLDLLRPVFGPTIDTALADRRRLGCSAVDVHDAFVALRSGRRAWAGQAVTLPPSPPRDRYGLPMEMVA
jgi:predicted RNase H-like nuclease